EFVETLDGVVNLGNESVNLRRGPVEEGGDGALFLRKREREPIAPQLHRCEVINRIRIATCYEHASLSERVHEVVEKARPLLFRARSDAMNRLLIETLLGIPAP